MALVKCEECRKEVSEKATACPACGAPIATETATPTSGHTGKRKTTPAAWAGLIIVLGLVLWYSQSRNFKEQSLPPIPIEVRFREALVGPGMVLRVKNKVDRDLVALVKLRNPTTQEEKSFRLDIAGSGYSEIGHVEGWVLAHGDEISIFNSSFRTWVGTIP